MAARALARAKVKLATAVAADARVKVKDMARAVATGKAKLDAKAKAVAKADKAETMQHRTVAQRAAERARLIAKGRHKRAVERDLARTQHTDHLHPALQAVVDARLAKEKP